MLQKTRGIVLHTLKYADKKVICKIYTREYGLQTYLVNVGSASRSKIKPALLQPLTQLELEVFSRQNREMGRLRELRCFYAYSDLHTNILKNTVATFLNELLYRSIHEEERNEELFEFMIHAFQWLDTSSGPVTHFHLFFMAGLSRLLGFYPHNNYEEHCFFDLMNGVFLTTAPIHPHYLNHQDSQDFASLFNLNLGEQEKFSLHKTRRMTLLQNLIRYYCLHIPGLKEIKSLAVLQATFGD